MKKQTYVVEIEMPDGDMISPGWLQDLIQQDCNSEGNEDRQKVSVHEYPSPSNLDEAAEKYASDNAPDYPDVDWVDTFDEAVSAFKAGAEWMAGQVEQVGVKESPSKTFPRVNVFETGASYRH